MTSSNVHTTATINASSVRPRPKRLITGLSDSADADLPPTPGLLASPYDSRSSSPLPPAHPQRSTSRNNEQKYAGSNSWGRRAHVGAQRNGPVHSASSPSLAGLWGSSWNTLQGIASDLLNEASEGTSTASKKVPVPKWYKQMTAPVQHDGSRGWGPPTSAPAASDIGKGTKEAQQAAMRAQKRKDMLLRQESSYSDTLGKFKRRLSDDMDARSGHPGGDDDMASLVYLHPVQNEDTMAGITIKYSCSANILRKANRMWANDTPQSRQIMVVPVGECSVKGRPVDAPDLLDYDRDEDASTPKASKMNGNVHHHRTGSNTSSATTTAADTDPPWQHHSWVQLPGFPAPTEIARLSRRALGYFPPARRKSPSRSGTNSPRTSLDLIRGSDDMRTESRSPQRPRRRRLSNANNGYFPSYLAGPGGVGTMNKNVRTPGPAQDGLNKIFARHLPDVAPPKNQIDLYQPELPMYTDDLTPAHSGMSTPSGTNRSNRPPNVNLENVGGAIESWVRRMATKAMTPNEAQARNKAARASVGTPGKGAGEIGDLIEMTNEFEIGGSDADDDEYAVEDEPPESRRGRPSNLPPTHPKPRSGTRPDPSGADYFGNATIGMREGRTSSSLQQGKAKKGN